MPRGLKQIQSVYCESPCIIKTKQQVLSLVSKLFIKEMNEMSLVLIIEPSECQKV